MRRDHLAFLVCPACGGDLEFVNVQAEDAAGIATGQLRCVGCGVVYPIVRHVPRFVPEQNYASGFGYQWTIHADTQYDSHTGVPLSETRFFEETKWPRHLEGQVVLEVGSGSGRFTVHAAGTGAMVISMDYSRAVDVNWTANGSNSNVLILQGDVYRMPFRPGTFDHVCCLGVLQHTPDVHAAFRALTQAVRPGGHLAVDVYRKPRGIKRLLATKYWVRPLTRRIPPERLYRLTSWYVRHMWPLARVIGRIPRLGKKLNWALLVADYRGVYPLSEEHLEGWAVLDTFDMLAPAYDNPQTLEVVKDWFQSSGFTDIEVHYGYNGIEGRGRMGPRHPAQ